jgi:S1-C subfamily serine protease
MVWTRLDFEPKEPFIPRAAIAKEAPSELAAMNMLGPLAKGLAFLVGRQEPDVRLPRGWFGLAFESSEASPAAVTTVLEGSPAAKAGVKPGDVLASVDGKAVASARAALAAVANRRPGRRTELTDRRRWGGALRGAISKDVLSRTRNQTRPTVIRPPPLASAGSRW